MAERQAVQPAGPLTVRGVQRQTSACHAEVTEHKIKTSRRLNKYHRQTSAAFLPFSNHICLFVVHQGKQSFPMKSSNLFHVGCIKTDGAEFINVKLQKRIAGTRQRKEDF